MEREKMKKFIEWRDDKRRFSNGNYGYVGVLRLFWIGYSNIDKKHRDRPYVLNTELPQLINGYRFKTLEEGYVRAEKQLKEFYELLKKYMER
jgi:hypothetical protein